MKRPLISVLLPVHNGAKTLGEAIASLQSQTLEDWEAVVVDDGLVGAGTPAPDPPARRRDG